MKPRNDYERRVAELNATLHEDIAQSNVDWVMKECDSWGHHNSWYFIVYTNIKEFEVRRLYRAYRFPDKNTEHFFFVEIMREFNDGTQKTYFSKARFGMSFTYDAFCFGSDIELRRVYKNFAGNQISMLMDDGFAWGSVAEKPYGKRVKCVQVNPNDLGRIIKDNPIAEMLYKQKDRMFVWLQSYKKSDRLAICRAIVIARRHGYDFGDNGYTSMWTDLVMAMNHCGADWHNPKYIAPKDRETLREYHDLFIKRMERINEQKRREAAIRLKMKETDEKLSKEDRSNNAYIKRRKKYYDMVLTDGLIECRVLPDIPAFRAEAEEMHHCVYTNEYYKKPYSLIMSATIGGKRIETIEVDLTSFTIKQCFGKHDQFTMYHQRILDLVNGQMNIIKETYTSRKRTTKVKIAV
jgi:hypothetical protein